MRSCSDVIRVKTGLIVLAIARRAGELKIGDNNAEKKERNLWHYGMSVFMNAITMLLWYD